MVIPATLILLVASLLCDVWHGVGRVEDGRLVCRGHRVPLPQGRNRWYQSLAYARHPPRISQHGATAKAADAHITQRVPTFPTVSHFPVLSQEPEAEKERTYRWLKRQFIQLAAASSKVTAETSAASKQHGEETSFTTAGKEPDGAFISWEFARDLLRRGPHCLENSLAIDLCSLSKDLWTADLVDIARTATVSLR